MCDKVRTAVEVIKTQKRKTLSKEETLMLFQKVIEDNTKMGERMTNLEKRMASLEEETRHGFDEANQRLHELAQIMREPSLIQKILLGESAKYFWITVIITLLILGGLLGVPTTGFNGLISLGG